MCYRLKEEVKRMSEKLYEVDQFYPGDFAQILTGVYRKKGLSDGRHPQSRDDEKDDPMIVIGEHSSVL